MSAWLGWALTEEKHGGDQHDAQKKLHSRCVSDRMLAFYEEVPGSLTAGERRPRSFMPATRPLKLRHLNCKSII